MAVDNSRALEFGDEVLDLPCYFLDSDNDGHWYLIPLANKGAWDLWCDADADDEASWEAPAFAKRLDGHPKWVTFTDPKQ